jgi:hypothetical protein
MSKKKMTLDEAKELHYQLWDWLYQTGCNEKEEWPEWEENGGKIRGVEAYCFVCEMTKTCETCPVDWVLTKRCCEAEWAGDKSGYFTLWCTALSTKLRKKYAKIIRDLPWKHEQNKTKGVSNEA